jgi:predicted dehydrogenase
MKAIVVGFGSIGQRHVRNLLKFKDIEIIICTKRTRINLKNKNRIKVFKSLEKSLDEKPDIGFITNETSLHVPTCIKLASRGIDLFIEKPLSNSDKEIKKMLKIVKNKKIVTLIGCNLRFNPFIQKIKELISTNQIGRIISIQVNCGTFLPDWHPYEDYRFSYAARKELGGGVILTVIHEIDYLYWFFGDVKEIFSISGKFSDLSLNVEDLSASLLRFKNNIIAELHLDYFQRPDSRSCKIIGTKGVIQWDEESNLVKLYNAEKRKWINKIKIKNYDYNDEYIKEITHFIRCVKTRKNSINSIYEGVKTLQIALAIKKASRSKKIITLS